MTRFSVCFLILLTAVWALADGPALILPENLAQLKCDPPTATYRFLGSNAPGQLFCPGEAVTLSLAMKRGADVGEVKEFALELQEITTRDPEARTKGAWTDTAGDAPLIALEGQPIRMPLLVTFTDKPETTLEVKNVPLPARFGTYALMLTRGAKRQFLGTLARVPAPRPDGTVENVPIFGEGQFMNGNIKERADIYFRMGIRGWRSELSWSEDANYKWNWENYDKLFAVAEGNGQKIMVTLGGHREWPRPFGQPTPASGWRPNSGGYGGTGDWLCEPKWYQRYENWITAFCYRYWKGGTGGLWGLENYNEPWEGGGISGWARDCVEYRKIQKHIATAARTVDPRIRLLAASSIMNTEDKLYSDGSNEFDKYVDIFTDHYVVPSMCYGPMVARSRGKESMETETWFVNSEYMLPQGVAQFMAAGQRRISPWHPRVLFDEIPGSRGVLIPTPVVAANAALNYFVTGKEFEKLVFHTHLPWVFQFGKDSDPGALLVVFGQLYPIGTAKERLWSQVDTVPGGTLTIDNKDGLLQFFDTAGNPQYVGHKTVKVPMNVMPTYIMCKKGPVVATQRLQAAKIDGKRPVEILPRDFAQRLSTPGVALAVDVHNCLNRAVTGTLAVTTPAELTLATAAQPVQLAAGETKRLTFAIAKATPLAANAYACTFTFTSDAGTAVYQENLNAAVVCKGSKTIDGNLDDWADVPGVMLIAGAEKMDPTELMRRPWLSQAEKQPDGTFGEIKLAWDENFLYVAARVNDPTFKESPRMAGRDENAYFHTKASDERSPYKEFLEKYPGRSFAEVPYVYCDSPEGPRNPALPIIPFRRDRLQIGLDVSDDWHDLQPTTARVPFGFHAVPDTDYEYSLYKCTEGSELWRQLAPGVARIHDFPRQPRGKLTTGAVAGAKHVVVRDGTLFRYEMAIPRSELAKLELKAGTTFGLIYKFGNDKGPSVEYGHDKAACKLNGLSLHPYWERSPNCGVRWTLIE
jgi:hypothetical protein